MIKKGQNLEKPVSADYNLKCLVFTSQHRTDIIMIEIIFSYFYNFIL